METTKDSGSEYRIDLRGQNGRVTRVRILERHSGENFAPTEGDFTQEHVQHMRLFSKVAAAVAKGVAPPLDIAQILQQVNTPKRRKKRSGPKLRGGEPPNN